MLNSWLRVLISVFATGVCLIPTCRAQVCGKPPMQDRIVGGTEATDGQWPWQVDIQMNGDHICGGSIISANWVLSAAHCFPDLSAIYSYTLYMGRYQLNNYNPYEMSRTVKNVVIQPGYTLPENGLDIALIQLNAPLTWTDRIQPICLPYAGVEFVSGTMCTVTGWGDIQEGVPILRPGTLRQVDVPIIDQSLCNSMYQSASSSDSVTILSEMICAGYPEGGKDSCQGDSGGPLVCNNGNGSWVQAGIVSFGKGCAKADKPGVYTKVSSYVAFISSYVPDVQLVNQAHHFPPYSLLVLILSLTVLM